MGRLLLVRNPGFGCFWVARLISYSGSAVTVAALVLYVYETEGSGVAVDKIESAARDDDILGQAGENAENSTRAFVTSLGFERVEFAD